MLAGAEVAASGVQEARCVQAAAARVVAAEQGALGEDQEGVARIQRERDAPERPECGAMTAQGAVVLDVVMHEREVVNELHGGRGGKGVAPVGAAGLAGQQTDGRAQVFAAGRGRWLEVFVGPAEMVAQHTGQIGRQRGGVDDLPRVVVYRVGEFGEARVQGAVGSTAWG